MKPHDVDAARRETLERALAEDAPHGDVTGEAYVPADAVSRVAVTAREAGVCSGLDVLAEVFALVDPAVEVLPRTADGRAVAAGTVLAEVRGPARAVLRGERVALNLLQRMCAIATTTAAHVEAARAAGADARVTDTRKTAPGCACSTGRRYATAAATTTAAACPTASCSRTTTGRRWAWPTRTARSPPATPR